MLLTHYSDVIMSRMASQITSRKIVYSTVYSGTDEHQSSASLAFVREIHRWLVNSPHKGPVTRGMFPFDDVIMHSFSSWWGHLVAGPSMCDTFVPVRPESVFHPLTVVAQITTFVWHREQSCLRDDESERAIWYDEIFHLVAFLVPPCVIHSSQSSQNRSFIRSQ